MLKAPGFDPEALSNLRKISFEITEVGDGSFMSNKANVRACQIRIKPDQDNWASAINRCRLGNFDSLNYKKTD